LNGLLKAVISLNLQFAAVFCKEKKLLLNFEEHFYASKTHFKANEVELSPFFPFEKRLKNFCDDRKFEFE